MQTTTETLDTTGLCVRCVKPMEKHGPTGNCRNPRHGKVKGEPKWLTTKFALDPMADEVPARDPERSKNNGSRKQRRQDLRWVYGVGCFWFAPIRDARPNAHGLPCCPTCSSLLYEVKSKEFFWGQAKNYDAAGHPGYLNMMLWIKAERHHFLTIQEAEAAYKVHQDKIEKGKLPEVPMPFGVPE